MDKWQSKGFHQPPGKDYKGTYWQVCLSGAGNYYLRGVAPIVSCPQPWAARIHQEENITILSEACNAEETPFTRAVMNIQQKEDCTESLPEWHAEEEK